MRFWMGLLRRIRRCYQNGKWLIEKFVKVTSYCKSNHAQSNGRGSGYPWKIGDSINLKAAKKRCEKAHSQGCEKNGELYYPKCAAGYMNVLCCVCEFKACPNYYYEQNSSTCYEVNIHSK